MSTNETGRWYDAGIASPHARNVLSHSATEQLDILRQISEILTPIFWRPLRDIRAIEAHMTGLSPDRVREVRRGGLLTAPIRFPPRGAAWSW